MRAIFVALSCFTLGGCLAYTPAFVQVRPYQHVSDVVGSTEHVVDRNYVLGQEQSVFVGEPMVRAKDYYTETRPGDARFISPVSIEARWMLGPDALFPPGTELSIVGAVTYEGREYLALSLPHATYATIPLLVTRDGRFENFAVARNGLVFQTGGAGGVAYTPQQIDFQSSDKKKTVRSSGFVNFEIVYSGTTKDSINLMYREYTPDDMAKPAFTQNLTYERGAPTIRFRAVSIKLLDASSERIRYVVESDGLSSDTSK